MLARNSWLSAACGPCTVNEVAARKPISTPPEANSMPRRLLMRLPLPVLFLLGILLAAPMRGDEASEARLKRDVTFLASDECEGRGVGTKGLDRAADYVAKQFAEAGLKPGGKDDSYFQPFPYSRGNVLDGPATLELEGPLGQKIKLKAGTGFEVMGFSGPGRVSAPLVFVGYGVTAKETGYDDYAGMDVKGKIVLAIRRLPRYASKEVPFDGTRKDQHAALDNKQALAAVHGAAALLLVNDATELRDKGDPLMSFATTARADAKHNLPFLHIQRSLAEQMIFSSLGQNLRDIEQAIDRDLKPQSAALNGWKATLDVKVKRPMSTVKNVIGVLPGAGPLANETVVIGAHYDHLGFGGMGSLAKGSTAIHHGADDNGSGTTALLELARRFGAEKDRQGRRLVFIAFTAEESGLIGSRYYCKDNPLFSLKDTVAMVNLDMVGRLRRDAKTGKDRLIVEGAGTAKGFDAMIDKLNPGFQLAKKASGNGPSDHDSFYNQKIPVVFLWTGIHEDYHRPSDTADKINVGGMDRIVDYAQKIIAHLATDPARPEYVAVAPPFSPGMGKGPRLGIMPDYEGDKPGVLVGGLTKDGPAAKGGVKTGDLIVEIAGKPVTSLNTYMAVMGQQTPGQPIEIGVLRDGKKVVLKVVPLN
jgi:hypothetical protein